MLFHSTPCLLVFLDASLKEVSHCSCETDAKAVRDQIHKEEATIGNVKTDHRKIEDEHIDSRRSAMARCWFCDEPVDKRGRQGQAEYGAHRALGEHGDDQLSIERVQSTHRTDHHAANIHNGTQSEYDHENRGDETEHDQFVADEDDEIGAGSESTGQTGMIRCRLDEQNKEMRMHDKPECGDAENESNGHRPRTESAQGKFRRRDYAAIDRGKDEITGAEYTGKESDVDMKLTEQQTMGCRIYVKAKVENSIGYHCIDEEKIADCRREEIETAGIFTHRFLEEHHQ